MCLRCGKTQSEHWAICASCQDPVRNYDNDGRPHGYQRMYNGNQEWRVHGAAVSIVLADGTRLEYSKNGMLVFTLLVDGTRLEFTHDSTNDASAE